MPDPKHPTDSFTEPPTGRAPGSLELTPAEVGAIRLKLISLFPGSPAYWDVSKEYLINQRPDQWADEDVDAYCRQATAETESLAEKERKSIAALLDLEENPVTPSIPKGLGKTPLKAPTSSVVPITSSKKFDTQVIPPAGQSIFDAKDASNSGVYRLPDLEKDEVGSMSAEMRVKILTQVFNKLEEGMQGEGEKEGLTDEQKDDMQAAIEIAFSSDIGFVLEFLKSSALKEAIEKFARGELVTLEELAMGSGC